MRYQRDGFSFRRSRCEVGVLAARDAARRGRDGRRRRSTSGRRRIGGVRSWAFRSLRRSRVSLERPGRASSTCRSSLSARCGRWPASSQQALQRDEPSRKPSRTPNRRLALSGPHSTQASARLSACAHSERSPRSRSAMSGSRTHAAALGLSPTLWIARQARPRSAACIDLLLLAPALEAGLGLDHAVLDGLDAIAAGQRPPGADPPALEDDVGVDQNGPAMTRHGRLTARPGLRPRASRKGPQDRRASGRAGRPPRAPRRALVDRERDHLHERLARTAAAASALRAFAAVVAQRRVRDPVAPPRDRAGRARPAAISAPTPSPAAHRPRHSAVRRRSPSHGAEAGRARAAGISTAEAKLLASCSTRLLLRLGRLPRRARAASCPR